MPDFVPDNTSTTAVIPMGTSVYGTIETIGDHDWYAVQLEAGQTYEFRLHGVGLNEITDTLVTLRDASGNTIASNDNSDSWSGANSSESRLVFTATTSGTYYVDASTYLGQNGQPRNSSDATTGNFLLTAVEANPNGMVFTNDEIAWQLTNNGSEAFYGRRAVFVLGADGALTVNVTNLTAEGQVLARAALKAWSDVSGIAFVETTGSAEINFDDSDSGVSGYAQRNFGNGQVIASANVMITTGFLSEYGTGFNSYSYEAYIHEIGHALGFLHGGNYNGFANYGSSNFYLNDSVAYSIMSYMNAQNDELGGSSVNTFVDASFRYMLTPAMADIIAIQNFYGDQVQTATRTGDTTYGYGANTGNAPLDAAVSYGASMFICVYDNGGIDTLNFDQATVSQVINLNAESFSNVLGGKMNLSIARGTVIENANGGTGADTIIGNQAGNTLRGNGGADTLIGSIGNDTLLGGANNDILYGDGRPATPSGIGYGSGQITKSAEVNNGSSATALDVTNAFSLASNANIGDSTSVPHVSINAAGGGHYDFYKITVAAGTTITLDLDFSVNLNAGLTLYNPSGQQVGFNDNASTSRGGGGSSTNNDPYLRYTATVGGTYVFAVSNSAGAPYYIQNGQSYVLQVSASANAIEAAGRGSGNDTLDGGEGADIIDGGNGIDTASYVDRSGALQITLAASGDTIVYVDGNAEDTLRNIENLSGGSGNDVLTGNAATTALSGNGGNDTLVLLAANNGTFDGGDGIDTIDLTALTSAITLNLGYTSSNNNTYPPSFTVDGGYGLLSNFENAIGTSLNDRIVGNAANNNLQGGEGDDTLEGGAGGDLLDGGGGIDTISYEHAAAGVTVDINQSFNNTGEAAGDGYINVENILGSAFDDTLRGAAENNVISGGGGSDTLDGGGGADTLKGSIGNDTYYVDAPNDQVVELAGEGSDTVVASVSYVLQTGQEVETLQIDPSTGSIGLNLSGNSFANTLRGNAGANTLSGGAGADQLYGLAGNDIYAVDNAGDLVFETTGQGSDTVVASVSYMLQAGQEVETIQFSSATGSMALNLTGNEFANTLRGNGGANTLNGGAGVDKLYGLAGNDIYAVDDAGDLVFEATGQGSDTVIAMVSYVLQSGQEIETLELDPGTGSMALNLSGNGFANTLRGNTGANTLSGGAGADSLYGLAGNDIYAVDNAGDKVFETTGQGSDTVVASVNYVLQSGQSIETLQLSSSTGSTALNLTGNEFANTLRGNGGANTLNGGAGADKLYGLAGNDIYAVDNAGDLVFETTGQGSDTVVSTISYVLQNGQEIETLQLSSVTGSTALNLTGNELANTLRGNAGGQCARWRGRGGQALRTWRQRLFSVLERAGREQHRSHCRFFGAGRYHSVEADGVHGNCSRKPRG